MRLTGLLFLLVLSYFFNPIVQVVDNDSIIESDMVIELDVTEEDRLDASTQIAAANSSLSC